MISFLIALICLVNLDFWVPLLRMRMVSSNAFLFFSISIAFSVAVAFSVPADVEAPLVPSVFF